MKKIIIISILTFSLFDFLFAMSKTKMYDSYTQRRNAFIEIAQEKDGLVIFHSAPIRNRNNDVDYFYRQSSNFIYLTGWDEPEAILVINPSSKNGKIVQLFVLEKNPTIEVWTGKRRGVESAMSLDGIDTAYAYSEFSDMLNGFMYPKNTLILDDGGDKEFKELISNKLTEIGMRGPQTIINASAITSKMRLIKSPTEIASLQKAIDITGESLVDAWADVTNCAYEYEVEALIEYGFRKRGSARNGFPSIVGSGFNATILHYDTNQDTLTTNGLIVTDIGAEWDNYSADITRTIPSNGKFSKAQTEIYQLVLEAQKAAIDVIKPGVSWRETHREAQRVITIGLIQLELLSGDLDSLLEANACRKYFLHGTSHWLGLDVHDVGGYLDDNKEEIKFEKGMVLTVEPGLYFRQDNSVPKEYWGMGVRIEDDILVTKKGHIILSEKIPKEIQDIERIVQNNASKH